jgi:exopolysaccharide biosynthesis polyprenyl glycosylphosphotransferase
VFLGEDAASVRRNRRGCRPSLGGDPNPPWLVHGRRRWQLSVQTSNDRTGAPDRDFRLGLTTAALNHLYDSLDEQTVELLHSRRNAGVFRGRGWLLRHTLPGADVVGLAIAFVVAQRLYAAHLNGDHVDAMGEFLLFVLSLPAWTIAAKLYGLYDHDEERADHSTVDDFVGVFHLVTVGTFVLLVVSHYGEWFEPPFSKLFVFWLLAVVSVTTARAMARAICRRRTAYLQNTIIVGAGNVGQELARKVLKHPEYGLNLVGFVDGAPKEPIAQLDHLTLLGEPDHLPGLVKLLDVERVIVAFTNDPVEQSLDTIRAINELGVQVDIVPRFFDVLGPHVDVHTIEGVPLWALPPMRLTLSARVLKRTVDILGASLGLLVLSPLFALTAIAIKLDSPGPVFFRQARVGQRARTFSIWKFRSMTNDADARKEEVSHLNKHLAPGGDPRMFKIPGDPRCTRVGAWLRRTTIDELPQLFNVLVGEMSLVGPRPLIPEEHRFVSTWGKRRSDLRPGMTGLWQVLGRDEIGFEEMVRLDYRYVTRWSLWRDMVLLVQTVPAVLRRRTTA